MCEFQRQMFECRTGTNPLWMRYTHQPWPERESIPEHCFVSLRGYVSTADFVRYVLIDVFMVTHITLWRDLTRSVVLQCVSCTMYCISAIKRSLNGNYLPRVCVCGEGEGGCARARVILRVSDLCSSFFNFLFGWVLLTWKSTNVIIEYVFRIGEWGMGIHVV